jgi:tetratricopeptide (TPR) repeat protein
MRILTRTGGPMRERFYEDEKPYSLIVYAVAMLLVGGLAGYILSSTATRPAPGAPAVAAALPAATTPAPTLVDETQVKAYRDILARDPRNFEAAVALGNVLYDGKRYLDAIPYYQQALAVKRDVNVSTDLGTALWYSGRSDEALAQYAASLAIDPNHAQTLFNVGIVRSQGKSDYAGAIAAWQQLLEHNPAYANAAAVRTMIADAREKTGGRLN